MLINRKIIKHLLRDEIHLTPNQRRMLWGMVSGFDWQALLVAGAFTLAMYSMLWGFLMTEEQVILPRVQIEENPSPAECAKFDWLCALQSVNK